MKNPFLDKLVLGLHFDGAAGGSVFQDAIAGNSWVASGAVLSAMQSVFGGVSGQLNGSAWISGFVPGTASVGSLWTFGCFFYLSAAPSANAVIFDSRNASGNDGLVVYVDSSLRICCSVVTASGIADTRSSASSAVLLNTWNYVAVSAPASQFVLYLNGVRITSSGTAAVWSFANSTNLQIGRSYAGSNYFTGFIDEVTFYRDVGLYSASSHQVPADPFGDVFGWDVLEVINPISSSIASVPDLRGTLEPGLLASHDIYYGGRGVVTGTVKNKATPANVPVVRRVRLYRDVDGVLVGETWSNDAGAYAFSGLDPAATYTAISYDHTGLLESVCASGLKATVAA